LAVVKAVRYHRGPISRWRQALWQMLALCGRVMRVEVFTDKLNY